MKGHLPKACGANKRKEDINSIKVSLPKQQHHAYESFKANTANTFQPLFPKGSPPCSYSSNETPSSSSTEESTSYYTTNRTIHTDLSDRLPFIQPSINGVSVKLLIDTGASVSILNKTTYDSITHQQLENSDLQVISYTGDAAVVLGASTFPVTFQPTSDPVIIRFQVVKNGLNA